MQLTRFCEATTEKQVRLQLLTEESEEDQRFSRSAAVGSVSNITEAQLITVALDIEEQQYVYLNN
jgi:hypothetical protein